MTFEEDIRLRQAFEKEVAGFLRTLAGLTTGELELAAGRVADWMLENSNKAALLDLGVRGRILHLYLEHRMASGFNAEPRQRKQLATLLSETHAESLGRKRHAAAISRWKKEKSDYERRLGKWREIQSSRSWPIRVLKKLDGPTPPADPGPLSFYVNNCRLAVNGVSSEDLEELLVDYAAEFQLPSFHGDPNDITLSDIQRLID